MYSDDMGMFSKHENAMENGNEQEQTTNPFEDKSVRSNFIRKVYCILSVQLLVTLGFVCAFAASEDARRWIAKNFWLFWVAMGTSFVLVIAMVCCDQCRRRPPINYICLVIFTLSEGFLVGVCAACYNYRIIIMAVAITALVVISLTLFAIQTKIDFTLWYGLAFVFLVILVIFGLILIFWQDPIANLVYSCLGALLFAFYLVIDTQMIVGGHGRRYQLSPDDTVYAALTLYLDIVNMFLFSLSIIGGR